jgi:hypothetical protein
MPAIFPKWTNWLPLQIGVGLALAWLLTAARGEPLP